MCDKTLSTTACSVSTEDSQTNKIAPQIHDGIGLDFESIRTLLAQKHGAVVEVDDPILMLVTLYNSFLGEYEKLLKRHNEALTAFLGEAGAQHLDAAREAAEAVTKGLSASSIGVIQEHLQGHRKDMASFQNNMVWLAAITAISAAVNVAVFVWRGM
jgi:hypothetical protein